MNAAKAISVQYPVLFAYGLVNILLNILIALTIPADRQHQIAEAGTNTNAVQAANIGLLG